jgi:hypothetical protein
MANDPVALEKHARGAGSQEDAGREQGPGQALGDLVESTTESIGRIINVYA